MPSPAAHFLAGLATHIATSPRDQIALRRRTALTVAAAMAPDLDFALKPFGLASHQGASHSLGAAVIAGVAVAFVALALRWPGAAGLGLAATLGWTSHLALDMLNLDTHPPIGLPALWPLGAEYYKVPWPVFLDVGRALDWKTVRHDALAVTWEAIVLCPVVVLAWRARRGVD